MKQGPGDLLAGFGHLKVELPKETPIHHSMQCLFWEEYFNTLRPREIGRHFAEDTLKCIFLNEYVWISIEISVKFVPKGPVNNIPE